MAKLSRKKKIVGDSMLVPPEREEYQAGSLIKKGIRALSENSELAIREADRAAYKAEVVAQNKLRREKGQVITGKSFKLGEPLSDERLYRKEIPAGSTKFKQVFAKNWADSNSSFEFEGNTYSTSITDPTPEVGFTPPSLKNKKAKGGPMSMLSNPEREMYKRGSLVSKLIAIFKPLSSHQKGTQAATRGQVSHNKDVATGIVVAGGLGYLANSDEGMALLEAADAGEIDAEIKETDERINPEDFPTYQKDTNSAAAFQNAFGDARKARADTFEFEGRTYLADLPVTKKAKGGTMKRDAYQEGGSMLVPPEMADMEAGAPVDTYPNIPPEEMAAVEASQLPDAEVEDNYIDYVMSEALEQEEQSYLMTALEADPQLSMIFDKVVDTASEFSGAGPVDGPGDGVSDSIPARLSAGEFVVTKKATDQIGADQLQTMMDDAERAYDGGLMQKSNADEEEGNIKQSMLSSNQMPSLNIRER